MDQIARGLVERGHDVTVFTSFPHYERFRVVEGYRGRLYDWDESGGVEVLRLPVYARGRKDVMLNRLLSYLSFNLGAVIAATLTRRRFDVVLCTNGSFFTGITGWVIGGLKNARMILNVQDLYPDVPVQAGQLRNGLAVQILRRLERFMYRKADHITVITESFRENLRNKGVTNGKVSIVPNFADTDFIRPLPRDNAFSQRHGLDGRFVVMHAGNLGYVYDLDTMIDAAALLREDPEILFLVVGSGVEKAALEERARRLAIDNVRFLPYQPRAELPWMRAASDVQVALYRRGAGYHSLPCKIYEIMASGRPLLASSDPGTDLHRLVETAGCGVWVDTGDPHALASAIRALKDDPKRRDAMGRAGRETAGNLYSRDVVVARYGQLLEHLAGAPVVVGSPRPASAWGS